MTTLALKYKFTVNNAKHVLNLKVSKNTKVIFDKHFLLLKMINLLS